MHPTARSRQVTGDTRHSAHPSVLALARTGQAKPVLSSMRKQWRPHAMPWHGMAWHGMAWHGLAVACGLSTAGLGTQRLIYGTAVLHGAPGCGEEVKIACSGTFGREHCLALDRVHAVSDHLQLEPVMSTAAVLTVGRIAVSQSAEPSRAVRLVHSGSCGRMANPINTCPCRPLPARSAAAA